MKNPLIVTAICGAIAGCGGGGGGAASVTTPPVVERLASYIGSYSCECAGHELYSATIVLTPGTTDSVNFTTQSDYYSGANCSGAILGTLTESGTFTAKYVATVSSSVIFTTGTAAIPANVD
ncbi:MAG TPA: hypothetical protein VFR42_01110, partial [Candidatus Acidoferrum sp.]|nr:hypothetical protein [Candidatus Acidoferrum sp.]